MLEKIKIKTRWDQLTYREGEQITQVLSANIPDTYKTTNLISILSGESVEDIESLPTIHYMKLIPLLEFLKEPIEEVKHRKSYVINNRKYILQADIDKINTAQWVDYSNYMQEDPVSVVKLASCFLIPQGHTYGDGYNISDVWNDIGDMRLVDIKALAFFFRIQYAALLIITHGYSMDQMKKTLSKKDRRKLRPLEDHLRNTVSSLLSQSS